MTEKLSDPESLEKRWIEAKHLLHDGDKAGALFLLKALAREGELAAFREVANIYELPDGGGVSQDFQKAREWYIKSIEQANDVYGCLGLGRIYYYGKGVPRNFDLAFEYYSMIEDKDIPVVNLMFGRMYSLGHGVQKDYKKAKEYYAKAIASGNVVALKDLALMEIEMKRYLTGVIHWIKAAIQIIIISLRNRYDQRLRSQ